MKKTMMAGALTLALAGPAFGQSLWDGPGLYDTDIFEQADARQKSLADRMIDRFKAENPVLPSTRVYPCGFDQGNARALASCQRDYQANQPDETWRFWR